MKSLISSLFLLCVVTTFGQTISGSQNLHPVAIPDRGYIPVEGGGLRSLPQPGHPGSRSQSINFYMDYGALDSAYAANVTLGSYYNNTIQELNRRLPLDSAYTLKWAFTWYPRIIDFVNNPVWPFTEYPASRIQMTIDSVYLELGHIHNAGAGVTDSIVISVWDYAALANISFDSGCTGTLYGRILATTNVSLTGPGTGAGTVNVGYFGFKPTAPIVIPQGKKFVIQVDFFGPASDQFYLMGARRLDCASTCGASTPYVQANYNANLIEFNSEAGIRYINPAMPSQNGVYPVIPDFFSDCNANGVQDTLNCEYYSVQDNDIFPYLTVVIPNFYTTVTPSAVSGCAGDVITLTASAAGSAAVPYTYSWSTSSGTLSAGSGNPVSLSLGNTNATVIVTATDANNLTTIDTIVITSNAINVAISNSRPLTVACGSTVTITTTVTGNQTGKNYAWSTGVTGATKFTVLADSIGNYVVTVTNSAGCSSSDGINVTYAGGVANVVNFQVPLVCVNMPATFTNQSGYTASPWAAVWNMGDAAHTTLYTTNATFSYTALGVYTVTLEMDSANCKFYSTPQQVVVHPASYPACIATEAGFINLDNSVALYPNPSTDVITAESDLFINNQVQVVIFDLAGKMIQVPVMHNNNKLTFNTAGLSAGMYWLKLSVSGEQVSRKFVKM